MKLKIRIFTVLSIFLLAACGGDDASDAEQELIVSQAQEFDDEQELESDDSDDQDDQDEQEEDEDQRMFINEALTGDGPAGNGETWESVLDAGLTVRTFEQEFNGATVPRRFLQYLPEDFDSDETYPLVIVMHGLGINAEITRQFDTEADLEPLADEYGFVVVYGNASAFSQPAPDDDPFLANTGAWVRSFGGPTPDLLSLDLDYLVKIEEDLASQGVQINPEARFVSGISNGGEMTLYASDMLAPRYKGAYAGIPVPIAPTNTSIDMSMMIYYSVNDPLLGMFFPSYGASMQSTYEQWAATIGIEQTEIDSIVFTELQDIVNEGEFYSGNSPQALSTRNSMLEQAELLSANGQNQLLVIRSETAGHGIPHPFQFDIGTVENANGFRNEDLNSVERMWEFFEPLIP